MKMSVEEVRNWLEQYVPYKGKIESIKTRIDWLKEEVELIQNMKVCPDEVIEGAALQSQKYNNISVGPTNEIHSKTESIALSHEDSFGNFHGAEEWELKDLTQYLEQMHGEIDQLERSLRVFEYRVAAIDVWFEQLEKLKSDTVKKQLFVVELLYKESAKMEEVKMLYYNKYDMENNSGLKYLPQMDSERIYKAVCRVRNDAIKFIAEFTV